MQAEAGLLGYIVKLGPHVVTHPGLAIDDVAVSSAVDRRIKVLLIASRVPLASLSPRYPKVGTADVQPGSPVSLPRASP